MELSIAQNWPGLLTFALTTGVATAVANQGLQWLRESKRDHKQITRKATYLAIRLASILEQFAIECGELISSDNSYRQSNGHIGQRADKFPNLGVFPAEDSWEALDPQLLGEALTIHNEMRISEQWVKGFSEIDEPDEELCLEAGKCGYLAWSTAKRLREKYKLPPFDPKDTSWDVVRTLKIKHDAVRKRAQNNKYVVKE